AGGAGGSSAGGAGGSSAGGAAGAGGDSCAALDASQSITLYQSSDDSNSMASPVLVRKMLMAGNTWVGAWVRPYEFLNYYRIDYQPAEPGHVRVVPQLRAGGAEGEYELQIALRAPASPKARRKMNLSFVLDTSGSMQGARLDRLHAVMRTILGQLQAGDLVSVATWNTSQQVLFDAHVAVGPNDPALLSAMDALQASGGTDLSNGLKKGYAMAQAVYDPSYLNRVVLISDGEANVGQTDANIIGTASHAADDEGIYLVGVNVGDGAGDNLMNIVTDKGRGASVFIDTVDEAARMFGPRFDETMEVAARGVRLELTLPWYLQLKSFSGEQSSTNPKEVDPQHLSADDAMVFNQVFAACSPSVVSQDDVISAKATWQTPLTHEAREDGVSFKLSELLEAPSPQLAKGSAIYAYAMALRAGTLMAPAARAQLVADTLAKVSAANPTGADPELNEIAMLLKKFGGNLSRQARATADIVGGVRATRLISALLLASMAGLAACGSEDGGELRLGDGSSSLTLAERMSRYAKMRDAATARGIVGRGYLLAGIAMAETNLQHCWSEATWACQGPSSSDCGGGPVIAGSADGPCSAQQGGLGMFQFDAGTYTDTLNKYGADVLTVAGNTSHAIDYTINMVKISAYTTNAETDAKAKAWINAFDLSNPTLRDQWIKTVTHYYNGCAPSYSCWSQRYAHYNDSLSAVVGETGLDFWGGAPKWKASYVAQSFPLASQPFELFPGEERAGSIDLKNDGQETWRPGEVFLGTTQPRDGASAIAGPGWPANNRAATVEKQTAPGQTGRFAFTVKAPATPGDHAQFFGVLREGVAWFSDSGQGGPPDDQLQVKVTTKPSMCAAGLGPTFTCQGDDRVKCDPATGAVTKEPCANGCSPKAGGAECAPAGAGGAAGAGGKGGAGGKSGAAGSAGKPGAGGAGAGGEPSAGGAQAAAGKAGGGAGGAKAPGAGAGGARVDPEVLAAPDDGDGGCGCAVPRSVGTSAWAWAAVAALAGIARRRRGDR
ncbi:MAG: VWA domain-containing protein, partial [Polyangiaceae bacterium]|nr:VWA domain-containing protein [Polyangiaceae bacterium]